MFENSVLSPDFKFLEESLVATSSLSWVKKKKKNWKESENVE